MTSQSRAHAGLVVDMAVKERVPCERDNYIEKASCRARKIGSPAQNTRDAYLRPIDYFAEAFIGAAILGC